MPIARFARFLSALFPVRGAPPPVRGAPVRRRRRAESNHASAPSRTPFGNSRPGLRVSPARHPKNRHITRPRIPAPLQGEPGSAGACTPQSRAAAPCHAGASRHPAFASSPSRARPRALSARSFRGPPRACPEPVEGNPAFRPPVVPRPLPTPAPKRPAAPSVIPANPSVIPAPAGIQPPHPRARIPTQNAPRRTSRVF